MDSATLLYGIKIENSIVFQKLTIKNFQKKSVNNPIYNSLKKKGQ